MLGYSLTSIMGHWQLGEAFAVCCRYEVKAMLTLRIAQGQRLGRLTPTTGYEIKFSDFFQESVLELLKSYGNGQSIPINMLMPDRRSRNSERLVMSFVRHV